MDCALVHVDGCGQFCDTRTPATVQGLENTMATSHRCLFSLIAAPYSGT